MKHKLLTAKHWQLFLITTGIPFVAFFISMMIMISQAVRASNMRHEPDPADFILVMSIAGIVGLVASIVHFSWLWSVSTELQRFMHADMRKLKVQRFKLFFFVPIVYIVVCLGIFVPTMIAVANPGAGDPSPGPFVSMMLLFMLLHFFSIFCIIYTMYFTVKTLRSVEMQKEAHFSDYIGEFFLLYFFPVGVWFLQPRINAIMEGKLPEPPAPHQEVIDKSIDF